MSLELANKLAAEKYGECLSTYYDYSKKLKWKCIDNHIWEAKLSNVKNGSWCNKCSWYINEEKCRYIFKNIFNKEFSRNRKICNPFEIDGFNHELNLAFEYNGTQHYQFVKQWHKNLNNFQNQIQRDCKIQDLCKEKNIILITIPYFCHKNDNDLIAYIVEQLKNNNIIIKDTLINWKSFYENLSVLKILRRLAESRNGYLLSNYYNGSSNPLEWQCKCSYKWFATPTSIKGGSWCPKCAHCLPIGIQNAQLIAKAKNGKLLSTTYIDNRTKMKWECEFGHVWLSNIDNIKTKNSWCPICAKTQKLTIEEMIALAKSRQGECLSNVYVNNQEKLEWQCKCGYVWLAMPNKIKNGSWCPKCAQQLKPTINELKDIAKKFGGFCLATEYINAHTKIQWQCKEGHVFHANTTNVKQNKWCRICSIKKRTKHKNLNTICH